MRIIWNKPRFFRFFQKFEKEELISFLKDLQHLTLFIVQNLTQFLVILVIDIQIVVLNVYKVDVVFVWQAKNFQIIQFVQTKQTNISLKRAQLRNC